MPQWEVRKIRLDLQYSWTISRGSSEFKQNVLVICSDASGEFIGEAAPNTRYGESPEQLISAFSRVDFSEFESLEDLSGLNQHLRALSIPSSLKFAIETAWLRWFLKEDRKLIEAFGAKSDHRVESFYTIPIVAGEEVIEFIEQHQLQRFSFIKLKVNKDTTPGEINRIQSYLPGVKFAIDGNECWREHRTVLEFVREIRIPLLFIEQPLPASFEEEQSLLFEKSITKLIADESITDRFDPQVTTQFHGVNIKLNKAGGIINALDMLFRAKKAGMVTMTGCMVETGLGVFMGSLLGSLTDYADLDSFMYLQNDPFPMVVENNGTLTYNDFPSAINP